MGKHRGEQHDDYESNPQVAEMSQGERHADGYGAVACAGVTPGTYTSPEAVY